jgi:hypothetical protein
VSETCRVILQLLINILPSCIALVPYIYLTSELEGKIHCLGWKVLYSVQRCGFLEVWVLYISDLKRMVIVLVTVMVMVVVDVLIVNWWRGCDKCNYSPPLVSKKW